MPMSKITTLLAILIGLAIGYFVTEGLAQPIPLSSSSPIADITADVVQTFQSVLNQIVTAIAGFVLLAIGIVGTWAIWKLKQKLGLDNDATIRAGLDDAAMKSIQRAVMQHQEEIAAKGWDNAEVQARLIEAATAYIKKQFPDTLTKAGVDTSTAKGSAAVEEIVTRALPEGTAAAAASPTTPPAPPADGKTIIVTTPPKP